MSDVPIILLFVGAATLIGLATVTGVGLRITREWAPTAIGLSPFVGLLVCGIVASGSALIGTGVQLRVVLPLSAVLVALTHARRWTLTPWECRPRARSRLLTGLEVSLLVTLVAIGATIVRLAAVTPLRAWDGWAIWSLHGHALFTEGSTNGPVFTDPLYGGAHPEYPTLYPALVAMSAHAIGRFDTVLIDVVPAVFVVSGALAVWAVLRTLVPPSLAAGIGVGIVGTPQLLGNIEANYADGLVAIATAVGVLLLGVWCVSRSTLALGLASLSLCGATLIKAEGTIFTVAAFAAAAVATTGHMRELRRLALAAVGTLTPAMVWYGVAKTRGAGAESFDFTRLVDPGYLVTSTDRIVRSAESMKTALTIWWAPSIALTAVALVLGMLVLRARPVVFMTTWIALSFTGLVSLYVASTEELTWHLATSASRVIYSVALGAFALAPLVATNAWDTIASRELERSAAQTGPGLLKRALPSR